MASTSPIIPDCRVNHSFIASALLALGPENSTRCFEFLEEQDLDKVIELMSEPRPRSMFERILILAGLARRPSIESDHPDALSRWEDSVESVFAGAAMDPGQIMGRIIDEDVRVSAENNSDFKRPSRLVQYDNIIERLSRGASARSEQVRVREWIGYVASTANLADVVALESREGHALELIYRRETEHDSGELLIRDSETGEDLGMPDYPEASPPWVLELRARGESPGPVFRIITRRL